MSNTSSNFEMAGVLLGKEVRKRKTLQEKIAIIQQTMEPGMTVSHVARLPSDNKPDKRHPRRDEAADAEVLSCILDIIGDMPAYGYRRVWAILSRQSRNEGLPFVNAKRIYRIMSENNLLLLHDKPSRQQREHKGRISVKESDQRWCSDGFEFGCDDGEKLRVTFVLDCCDREAIDWAASTGGYDKATVQDVMLGAIETLWR
ncbi:TPA: IS3 family transposase [Escherichia coli]|nr:IS3 family transposase [Escherichia coli]HCI4996255.1 IS3 family transposase [Escherichia coli]